MEAERCLALEAERCMALNLALEAERCSAGPCLAELWLAVLHWMWTY